MGDPTVRAGHQDGRLYGRGTADNKGPLMVHIAAVARLLAKNPQLPLRITFVVEGEEEIGSKNFKTFLLANREKLRGDFVYLSDTGIPSADQMVITVALRGMLAFEVEITDQSPTCTRGCMAAC